MGKLNCIKKPGKKWIVIAAVGLALSVVLAGVLFTGNGKTVEFRELSEQEYPQHGGAKCVAVRRAPYV